MMYRKAGSPRVYGSLKISVRIARRTAEGKDISIAIFAPGSIFAAEVVFSSVERTSNATMRSRSPKICLLVGP
jgi:CRP-like cAMP-binding protein